MLVCCPFLLQMLEELSPSPSSPPLGVTGGLQGISQDGVKVHNFKASSVTWCTDYLEVMGCEKQHNFKVNIQINLFMLVFYL